jgi:hypothetical protein
MLEVMDKKHVTALILLELSTAFDSINHTILLHKLKCAGSSPLAIQWFEGYLSGRSQYVRIGSTVSSTSALTHGVPQGSILSPFLFGIYVNDLPAVTISSDLDSYVDDSKLHLAFLVGNFLGKTLKPVSVAKDLGALHLDLHLSYDDHISKLSSTCINKLCQIRI